MLTFTLRKAIFKDLKKILHVQQLAFLSEAQSLGDFSISPLTQTLESVAEDFLQNEIIVAIDASGKVIGSIRGKRKEEGTLISRLSVAPKCQKNGIGKSLIVAMEELLPSWRYYLFTSSKNYPALELYNKLGYKKYKQEDYSPTILFYHLEKINTIVPENEG
ncbi:MAG: GNAT family N-acetyltransferase [Deltaproteobacteria bacterium]|nr:GNAT family N-acetyltransferase [Deltaproteobacteria bacterium]